LKIVLYSTQVIATHPSLNQYAGLETMVGLQAKYFSEQGHQVCLFAAKDSYFSDGKGGMLFIAGNLPAGQVNPVAAWQAYWNDERSRNALRDADIVCDASWGYYPYAVAKELRHIAHEQHGPDPGFTTKPPVDKPNLIGVSHNHAKRLSQMSGVTFRGVENGIDLDNYPFKKDKGDYFLWLSRIYEPKGTHKFIEICNKMQVKGVISGGSFGDRDVYVNQIKQMVDNSQYVTIEGKIGTDSVSADGQKGVGISHEKKVELYQNAKAVVIPSIENLQIINQPGQLYQFIEPFGLIGIEAGSCGTPFVGLASGGWQETITHGLNGFFANSLEEYIYYLRRIDEIKPEDCRRVAEHFSYKRMGAEYLKLFEEILAGRSW